MTIHAILQKGMKRHCLWPRKISEFLLSFPHVHSFFQRQNNSYSKALPKCNAKWLSPTNEGCWKYSLWPWSNTCYLLKVPINSLLVLHLPFQFRMKRGIQILQIYIPPKVQWHPFPIPSSSPPPQIIRYTSKECVVNSTTVTCPEQHWFPLFVAQAHR